MSAILGENYKGESSYQEERANSRVYSCPNTGKCFIEIHPDRKLCSAGEGFLDSVRSLLAKFGCQKRQVQKIDQSRVIKKPNEKKKEGVITVLEIRDFNEEPINDIKNKVLEIEKKIKNRKIEINAEYEELEIERKNLIEERDELLSKDDLEEGSEEETKVERIKMINVKLEEVVSTQSKLTDMEKDEQLVHYANERIALLETLAEIAEDATVKSSLLKDKGKDTVENTHD